MHVGKLFISSYKVHGPLFLSLFLRLGISVSSVSTFSPRIWLQGSSKLLMEKSSLHKIDLSMMEGPTSREESDQNTPSSFGLGRIKQVPSDHDAQLYRVSALND